MHKSRCLFIGRQALVLEGLRCLLAPQFDGLVVAPDCDRVRSTAIGFGPHVAIIQLDGESDGTVYRDLLCGICPGIRVVYLTDGSRPDCTVGNVSMLSSTAELLQAIHASAYEPRQRAALSDDREAGVAKSGRNAHSQLSGRAREVVSLLIRGLSMKAVGRRLGITARTVAFHKYRVMEANGLRNNADLLRFATAQGLSPFDAPSPSPRVREEVCITTAY